MLSPVGTEYMEVSPSGAGSLQGPIPVSRTSVPYNLVTALSGLGSEIQHYNIPQLEKALDVGSQDLNGTQVSQTTSAFQGLADISRVIGSESTSLATIVSQGANLSGVLSQRSHQLFDLFGQSDLVLSVLQQRRAAIDQLLSCDIHAEPADHLDPVGQPAGSSPRCSRDLQSVSAVLAKDSNDFGQAIPILAAFSRYAANATGSGAFVDVSVPTLLIPDNLAVQCSAHRGLSEQQPAGGVPAMRPRIYALATGRARSILRRIPIRMVLVVTTAAVVAAAAGRSIVGTGDQGPSPMTITARFATAPGLYPGNSVDVLGMPVGTVTKVTPGPTYVTVVMQVPATHADPRRRRGAHHGSRRWSTTATCSSTPATAAGPGCRTTPSSRCRARRCRSRWTGSSTASTSWPRRSARTEPTPTARCPHSWPASAHAFGGNGAALHSTLTSLGSGPRMRSRPRALS